MKITAIEAVPLAIPLKPMTPPSPWTGGTRKQIYVVVHTDEGGTCLVLRYYEEQGIDEIAETLGISRNSVKTHLRRGMEAMEARLGS